MQYSHSTHAAAALDRIYRDRIEYVAAMLADGEIATQDALLGILEGVGIPACRLAWAAGEARRVSGGMTAGDYQKPLTIDQLERWMA